MLNVSGDGTVSVRGVGNSINITPARPPRAINGTFRYTTSDALPNANLYTGQGVELADANGTRLALLTNVQ